MVVKTNTCLGGSYQVDINSRGVMEVTKIHTIAEGLWKLPRFIHLLDYYSIDWERYF